MPRPSVIQVRDAQITASQQTNMPESDLKKRRLLKVLVAAIYLLVPVVSQVPPSHGSVTDYAPRTNVECPDFSTTSLIRVFSPENQTLHPAETEYISQRAATVLPDAWKEWLGASNARHGYNLSDFEGIFPKVGMAIPGGGMRAALYGAGCLNGLDARNDTAKAAGTGGLLQVTSYLSGLSGGSWITGSLFFNNWPTINDMVMGNGKDMEGWLLDLNLVTPDGANIFSENNQYYYGSILWSVMAKAYKGIDTSLTDPWSRMISYHFLNQTDRKNFFTNDSSHGAGQLWSNIPLIPAYRQYQTPFPIVVADSRPVGSNLTTALSLDPVVYEITPLELASYDPNLSAGMNLTYAGTHLSNGKAENGSACVTGFDQAGFIMGSSASLFNQILDFAHNSLSTFSKSDATGLLWVLSRQLQEVRTRADDVANWPSPFNGLKATTFEDSDKNWLELIDGASNKENIPYGPLFVRARGLDVVVTIEGSADDPHNWPNGSSLLFTSQRLATLLRPSHQQFPPIPGSVDAFIQTGVNARPTFFGCDPKQTPPEYPLVIYLPNAPSINGDDPVTNTGTFTLSYTRKHQALFLAQVLNNTISGFTPNANTPDANYGTCLQCAAIDRARLKVTPPIPRSDICSQCFKQYCFDPQNPPSKDELPGRKQVFVDPDPQGLTKLGSFFTRNRFALIGGLVGLVLLIAAMIGGLLWWKKRKTNQQQAYKRVANFHEDDAPWKGYSYHPRVESYELPNHRGSLVH
ncbi:putative cytoplasmic phospholipase A2, catalytic subunit [Lyophyllum shimeji]|uniref:Lysophospholipase n=1 Tax=Lyophyllum shimeji TaxID=47721 RepID=A0A9P3UQN5_LYOSH|nr:putative cytoplasmic phospholipase A2, catalytic subunit [Lyophyllum shimeji]